MFVIYLHTNLLTPNYSALLVITIERKDNFTDLLAHITFGFYMYCPQVAPISKGSIASPLSYPRLGEVLK
jgi:hypothetical protein